MSNLDGFNILMADKVDLTLEKDNLKIVFDDKQIAIKYTDLSPLEALLVRLRYAQELTVHRTCPETGAVSMLFIPGQDTGQVFKKLNQTTDERLPETKL